MTTPPPMVHIDLTAFDRDPYPTLARLRAEAPVAFVPELNSVLLTRRDDIDHWEKQVDVFSSDQPAGLMNRLMGRNMMRKDGAEHTAERKLFMRAVSVAAVKDIWTARFQVHAERILDELAPRGHADLVADYALPMAGECLKDMTGLTKVKAQDIDRWSRAMIDGIANYSGDPQVEARCHEATAAIDAAIDDRLRSIDIATDASLLGVMRNGGMPLENVRNNIKLAISGGQNEPRKAIAGCIWALLTHPDALAEVKAGRIAWRQVLDEYVRWIAPIGMSPRRIAKEAVVGGVRLAPEARAFLMFGSANRDEAHFEHADRFMPGRDTSKAIAFGAGPHFCAGTWATRAMIADVALPAIFARLPRLRLAPDATFEMSGWAFRGLKRLDAVWA